MEEYITYDELKIKCNIGINRILHLSIRESIGTHALFCKGSEGDVAFFRSNQ